MKGATYLSQENMPNKQNAIDFCQRPHCSSILLPTNRDQIPMYGPGGFENSK